MSDEPKPIRQDEVEQLLAAARQSSDSATQPTAASPASAPCGRGWRRLARPVGN